MPLDHIRKKVENGERISDADARELFASHDVLTIGQIADAVRRKKNGLNTYYIVNRHINYTNTCKNGCLFCAYHKKPGEGGYTLSLDEIRAKAEQGVADGVSEFHVVGGLNDEIPFSYYLDMLRLLKKVGPHVHIQAFTMVELDYIAQIAGLSLEETLRQLKEAGLDSVPGGGAEIFDTQIRTELCTKKISGERWLEIAKAVHTAGMHSNATMLFGHIEKTDHIIDHLSRIRALQDETHGFLSFIPLLFHAENTEYPGLQRPSGSEILKLIAISRIYLDNVPHIKSFWIMLGLAMAQISQFFGVDDIDGTVTEERITHAAGAQTPERLSRVELRQMIERAGYTPVERDTLYTAR